MVVADECGQIDRKLERAACQAARSVRAPLSRIREADQPASDQWQIPRPALPWHAAMDLAKQVNQLKDPLEHFRESMGSNTLLRLLPT